MSGFAFVFDKQDSIAAKDNDVVAFKNYVADYKQLNSTCKEVYGRQCVAVKFDTASTLHHGITIDKRTGSWLIAVGTIIDSMNNADDGDLQYLLAKFLEVGNNSFQNLDGPFALVAYDKHVNKTTIVSDPLGFVSVFYAQKGSRIYVATSALAVAKAVQATPSEFGVYLFLTTGNVYGKSTLWQEVERLSPGTILEITSFGNNESVYWLPKIKDEITKQSLSDTVDYTLDLLPCLMMHSLKRESEPWVDLTGGFDSRLVTAMMDHCGLRFKTSCHGPENALDVKISSHIARKLSWDYQHFILPDDWGQIRYEELPKALGRADGHLDIFKLSGVGWDQDQRALSSGVSIWGLGGELWRGFFWKQEFLDVGTTSIVDYDRLVDYRFIQPIDKMVFHDSSRLRWIREELKSLLKTVGDRYPDSLNTVKLDRIYAFKNTGHTGAHISAVMGQQRVIPPLFLKDSVTYAISTNYKWRNHSRLVRLLIERVNPELARIETTTGGPALPMRVTNLYKFTPYWFLIGKQLVRKVSHQVFGRNILPEARSKAALSRSIQWRQETLNYVKKDQLLNHSQMYSGSLYSPEGLASFLEQARTEMFRQEAFLSRILTVEMALRSVGASF